LKTLKCLEKDKQKAIENEKYEEAKEINEKIKNIRKITG
jgi:hypothetical protein